ncbi:hypothetical protein Tco_0871857 [Tanacetum coccineum]
MEVPSMVTNTQKCWVNRVRKGEAKSTFGAGAFIPVNTGEELAVLWLTDNLGVTKYSGEIDEFASNIPLWHGDVMILGSVLFRIQGP